MKKHAIILILTGATFLYSQSSASGKIFFNHTTDLIDNGINAFNMKRAYLSYGNSVSDNVFYKVTYDMGTNDGGSAHTAFLKVAMLKWKTSVGDITIGMQGMNMFKTMENTWGHRFIAKMPMDTYKFSASADMGVGIAKSFGPLSTSALIVNGCGYKKAESDKYKKISFHALYGESKLNKKDGFNVGVSFSYEPYAIDSMNTNTTNVMGLFAGYSGNGFRGGLEFDTKSNGNIDGKILSIYGTYQLTKTLSILGRLDQADTNTSEPNDGVQAVIAGLHLNATKGLIVAPTFRMTALEGGDAENSIVVNFQFKF